MSTSLLRLVADLDLSLSAQVFAGNTTATLNDDVDGDNVSLPSGLYGFTISLGENDKEYIIATVSGTALTGIISISKQGASTTGFSKYHRAGATVTITDWAILKRILDNLNGTTGFDSGTNLGYDGAPAGLTGNQFATVNYVLSVVNGGTVTFDRQVIANQTLGETITANDIVYFKEADQRWWKADADLTATFVQVKLGVALSSGVAGGSSSIAISGPVSTFSGLTPGSKYYISNTAGAVTTSAVQTTTVFVGWALSATSLLFSPQEIYRPTATEKAILTQLAAGMPGIVEAYAGRSVPSGWLLCDGSAVSRTTYANLLAVIAPSGVVTVTIASPGVFSKTAHGLVEGDQLHFTTTGALPTGLATNTTYYVISTGLTADAFEVALSRGGAAVNTSGSQSGTHTLYASNFGKGDGSTTFNVPDLRSKFLLGMGGGTETLSVEAANVSAAGDTFTVSDNNFPYQGQAITLTTTGTLPAGLSLATTYYIVRASVTTIKFSTTQANADASTPVVVNITDQGTGIHTINVSNVSRTVLGQMGGEETHANAVSELASHTHGPPGGSTNMKNNGSGSGGVTSTNEGFTNFVTGSTGGDTQHNNMPPWVLLYWIIKT